MAPQTVNADASVEPIGAQDAKSGATNGASGQNEKKEILIDGNWVDVTSFLNKHPGGRVISYMVGTDGTQAFNEFHTRSERAQKMLKRLPSRPSVAETHEAAALLADYEKLRQQLVAEGMFKPSIPHVTYRISEIVAMHLIGGYLVMGGFSLPWTLLGLLILGLVQGRCGWFMHEGGHYSLTGNITVDRTIQEFSYGVGCGMSAAWWRSQHNRHHATPQKLKHDVDLDTLPLVAFHSAIYEKVKKNQTLLRLWISFQSYTFVPITTFLVAIGWQFFLHPRHIARKKLVNEAIAISLRLYLIFGVVLKSYTLGTATALYCFYVWIGAMYIFVNFAVSHTHKPAISPDMHISWVHYAANHTTNVAPSWWCNWWMGYLNFQIEHHLFPCMPQFRHPQIAPRVRALFKKHGLDYDVRSYPECVRVTLANLYEVANGHEHKH